MNAPVDLSVSPDSPDRNLALELVRVTEAAASAPRISPNTETVFAEMPRAIAQGSRRRPAG